MDSLLVCYMFWLTLANSAVIPREWKKDASHRKENVTRTLESNILAGADDFESSDEAMANLFRILQKVNPISENLSTETDLGIASFLARSSAKDGNDLDFAEILAGEGDSETQTGETVPFSELPSSTKKLQIEQTNEFGNTISMNGDLAHIELTNFEAGDKSLDTELFLTSTSFNTPLEILRNSTLLDLSDIFGNTGDSRANDADVTSSISTQSFLHPTKSLDIEILQTHVNDLQFHSEVTSSEFFDANTDEQAGFIPATFPSDSENAVLASSGEQPISSDVIWPNADFADASELLVSSETESEVELKESSTFFDEETSTRFDTREECPAPGICIFWFLSTDTCSLDEQCLENQVCCKIRCSKVCVDAL